MKMAVWSITAARPHLTGEHVRPGSEAHHPNASFQSYKSIVGVSVFTRNTVCLHLSQYVLVDTTECFRWPFIDCGHTYPTEPEAPGLRE